MELEAADPRRGAEGRGGVMVRGVKPVLANYVPVLDHPLFLGGLFAFGFGLALTFADGRIAPGREAPPRANRPVTEE